MAIRKNLAESHDPYLPWGGIRKASVCRSCGAVYHNKSWSFSKNVSGLKSGPVRSVLCPACRKIRDGYSAGVVTLRGDFLRRHKKEILQRVRNEEARAVRVNPLERIISITEKKDSVEVKATSERFAQRIGRELKRAFKGKTTYRWGGEEKQVRVDWERRE